MSNISKQNFKEKTVLVTKKMMCKLDISGVMEFANEYFVELSGYHEGEIMGHTLDMLFHPDMPNTIIDVVWKEILNKQRVNTIIKFLSKDGDYYWLQVKFDYKLNLENRSIENIYLYATTPERSAIPKIEKFYDRLLTVEKESDLNVATNYFEGYLEDKNLTYDLFIESYLKI